MTGEIFQSDIELAQRAISEGHGDEFIIEALAKRRIPYDKAAQLVAELRAGQPVSAAKATLPRVRRSHQSRSSSSSSGSKPAGENAPAVPEPDKPKSVPRTRPKAQPNPYNRKVLAFVGVIFVLVIITVAAIVLVKSRNAPNTVEDMFQPSPGAATNSVAQP